jgi:SAM-dependent methyltransferase
VTNSKDHIEDLLASEDFEYHRVELPHGLSTPGQDRSQTARIVFDRPLDGTSFLDIGCALGYFCFEAEKRGATRVVGLETSPNRIRQARLLAEAMESQVEFSEADFLVDPPQEQFDHVALLNVVHHLVDPIAGLHRAVSLAKRTLIVEFPTLLDWKFRRYSWLPFARILNRYPLMGVSSLRPKTDQTFVFTRSAIAQILTDHSQSVDHIEFKRSPMRGRDIAICHMGSVGQGPAVS